jgi:hypothetical protein
MGGRNDRAAAIPAGRNGRAAAIPAGKPVQAVPGNHAADPCARCEPERHGTAAQTDNSSMHA